MSQEYRSDRSEVYTSPANQDRRDIRRRMGVDRQGRDRFRTEPKRTDDRSDWIEDLGYAMADFFDAVLHIPSSVGRGIGNIFDGITSADWGGGDGGGWGGGGDGDGGGGGGGDAGGGGD